MLAFQIELKRKQMIHCAKEYGFTAKKTVKCSQELDALLNKQWEEQSITNPLPAKSHEYSLAQ